MKRMTTVALTAFVLFAALTLIHTIDNKRALTADGAPPPPWPKPSNSLVADGAPPPPWPPSNNSMLADAVASAPWSNNTMLADGAPPPPWPPSPKGVLDTTTVA